MCTAVAYLTQAHYFGRTLDLDYTYDEQVTITPRRFPFGFRRLPRADKHYALIGMATVANGYPLYYDATNEHGLSMAGLSFPGNAVYLPPQEGADNVAPFELIPWVLGSCASLAQARELLRRTRLVNIPFSEEYPLSPLHFMLSDRTGSLVLEPREDGLRIFDNPIEVMTNNPPFDMQKMWLTNFLNLTREEAHNRFSEALEITPYSHGLGAMGLPGDFSSTSRFVRTAFVRHNSVSEDTEADSVTQFFHILAAAEQPRGCVKAGDRFEFTRYTSCCNTDTGVYYYTTYENRQITAVDMHKVSLDGNTLTRYPLILTQQIHRQN